MVKARHFIKLPNFKQNRLILEFWIRISPIATLIIVHRFEQSLENQIELKEGNSYASHEAFVIVVKSYTKQQGFQVCLGRYEKNAVGQIRKRTIVCSREGTSGSSLKLETDLHNEITFISEERLIPLEVQQKIMLFQCTGCNIPKIQAILKEVDAQVKTKSQHSKNSREISKDKSEITSTKNLKKKLQENITKTQDNRIKPELENYR
ncbi:45524_t:CDS:2 [Gigaspora margarita]|uniref:45524_t:CDS:1 n=1 Tax=Gigaspora margarita TaxID=4874 RepID=A0ABN7U1M8_GIGMA|nr:45524_t:CDS:2 [Gigaspora margarita]